MRPSKDDRSLEAHKWRWHAFTAPMEALDPEQLAFRQEAENTFLAKVAHQFNKAFGHAHP